MDSNSFSIKCTTKFKYYIVLHSITMDVVSVKFQKEVLKKIDDSILEHNFNSRTEFIRDAVRDKLDELRKETLIKEFLTYNGKSKKKTSYAQNEQTRKAVSKELFEDLGKRFS